MGVVSECCCKEVYYRYPHNNYYFPLLNLYYIALFWQHHPYFFVHLKKFFSFFIIYESRSRSMHKVDLYCSSTYPKKVLTQLLNFNEPFLRHKFAH